ncbi:WD40-repeat-containing domain protein [Catenaria anguillulae PL171]|uniref:WD40-repeat-containing domain protein n=1 Tax=Catenaria anguillulae PL171 TaxID=765915 RepID=A0A1Y2HUB7_9FUNG|nr:WD40-repeat-containing domain protein [Catenaria anguillulae PL171]
MRIHTGPVLYSSFNQDYSCLAIGTRTGFRVFNCDPFGRSLVKNDGGIGIIEMLFTTSLIALVGAGEQPTHSPRKLQIMNTKKQSIICELPFASAVLAVHLNRRRLAVVLESSIQLYDIANMKLLYTVDLNYNPNMITAMSPASDMCYLAYPTPVPAPPAGLAGGSTSVSANSGSISSSGNPATGSSPSTSSSSSHAIGGDITLFDAISLHPTTIISAHKSPLAALAFSSSGRYLATASSKGTLIRVFGVPDGAPMYQFRRGTYPTRIYSLAFHPDESLLAVSSATETVHVFRMTAAGAHLHQQQRMALSAAPAGGGAGSGVASPDWVSETASIGSSVATYPPPTPSASGASDTASAPGAGGPLLSSLVGTASSAVSSLWSKRSALHAYLPESFVKSVLDPTRDIVRARVPTGVGERSVVGFAGGSHLMVVTAEGYLHVYAMDVEGAVAGGGQGVDECVMVRQYRLLDDVAAS